MPMGIWSVGDRVTCEFHHRIPATITGLTERGGFTYKLDSAHELGPRHGFITNGEAFDTSGWWHLSTPDTEGGKAK